MDHANPDGYAPSDLTDGRQIGAWKTRYPEPEARNAIRLEAAYVFVLFFACPVLLCLAWLGVLSVFCGMSEERGTIVCHYLYAWLGGLFGGTMFALKCLYHAVAHGRWNRDRRLWRLLTPHLSAGLGFIVIVMIESGLLVIFDARATGRPAMVVAIAFLVGYFSDTALAKLSEIAYSLFGGRKQDGSSDAAR